MKISTLFTLPFALLLALAPMAGHAQDAYLSGLSFPRYVKANVNYPVVVKAMNGSTVPVQSFSVRWKVDGGTWHTGNTITVTPPGLQQGYYMNVTHPVQLNVAQGSHTLTVEIVSSPDQNTTNNQLVCQFTAVNTWANKVVLYEGRTETWCPHCPAANVVTNSLALNPQFAVAKFHTSDGLANTASTGYYNTYYNPDFTPAAVLDMGEYGDYPANYSTGLWQDEMTARANGVAPASVSLTSSMNWTSRVLTVTVTANFTYSFTGTFKLNAFLLEDAVPGPQQSAPANYLHNKVVRAVLGGVSGTGGIIPNTPVVNTNYSTTYTYTVPAGYKLADLNLIGVLEHYQSNSSRYCVNAAKAGVGAVGIEELQRADALLNVFPNPFTDVLNVSLEGTGGSAEMELVAADGRVVMHQQVLLGDVQGRNLQMPANLPAGTYVVTLRTKDLIARKAVIKVD